ncbi:HupE/UreJ family protein [Ectothiorhodospiraceae bacterium WFHF3C12]|nr:HupE/UreJ family protein [Ectothiorhodospiraceae bacterium WFHF3C12]
MKVPRDFAAGTGLLLMPVTVLAHPGNLEPSGLLAGIAHPLGGIDHLLAMFAVGIWAAQAGGRALWTVPATFVAAMAAGGLAGAAGLPLPGVELAIVGSVIVFGALVAFARRLPLPAGLALTGTFAVFHGQAHVAEMGAGGNPVLYGAGFLLATAALHLAGAGLGQVGRIAWGANLIRGAGAVIGVIGATLLAGFA